MDMDKSQEARPVRRVRCPKCHSILQEPGAPVYQCGGCGTTLRAKNRAGSTGGSISGGALPPRSGQHLDAGTPTTPPDARNSTDAAGGRHDGASTSTSSTPDDATTGSRLPGDVVSARNRVSDRAALIEKRAHDKSAPPPPPPPAAAANQEEHAHGAPSPAGVSAVHSSGGGRKEEEAALQDDSAEEKRAKRHAESTEESRKKHSSGEAAVQPQYHRRHEEPAPRSSPQPAVQRREHHDAAASAAAAAGSEKAHEVQAQNLGPLRKKILQTVDELKGDLSELFKKSPELNAPRPPRAAVASGLPATARHAPAATAGHRGSAARPTKPARVAAAAPPPRGLPSRRYRQCRADPCCHSVRQPRPSCHHGCCRHHGKPECSSCRGYCCRPRAPSAPRKPPVPAKEAKRRLPPRNLCRPVLKGAPFIVCSSCFKLVQVPADFAVATKTVRKLRCGACSTVLSYSYRDPARKKASYEGSVDRCSSTDGSELMRRGGNPDPFAPFVDGFGLSSYSTDDEQPLHVSRNTSFSLDTIEKGVGRLHRLMGYGSASELLRQRHSPDLYESFSERTTPDFMAQYDRKGKSVCIDDDDDDEGYDVDDSDDEDGAALKRSAPRGPAWQLPWMLGKGTPAPGAIRIK